MREIKFRTYDRISYGMVYYDSLDDICEDSHRFLKGKYQHIMQYTGLKDKNGKEIYEGDIYFISKNFKTGDGGYLTEDKYLEVVFRKGQFVNKELREDIYSSLAMMVDYKAGEVVGNIYENPELLKGE